MLWASISSSSFAQVTISNEAAEKIISILEQHDSLKGAVSEITLELKKEKELSAGRNITDAVQESAYKTLENNYKALKQRFERYRSKNTLWRDITGGLIVAGITTAIILTIK